MPTTAKGTPYVVSTDLVANYPTISSDLADHIDDNLAYNAVTINAQTGSGANAYSFVLADASEGKLVTASNAAAATYTIPPQASVTWANGAVLRLLNLGAGVVTIAGGAGVTITGTATVAQYASVTIVRTASNAWTVTGQAAAGGYTLISTSSISAAASVSVNNCFSATYDDYVLVVNLSAQSSAQELSMRLRASGTDNTSSQYYFNGWGLGDSSATSGGVQRSAGLTNRFYITYNSNPGTSVIQLSAPFQTQRTRYTSASTSLGSTDAAVYWQAGQMSVTTSYDGVTIYPASGTITGTLRIYGLANS